VRRLRGHGCVQRWRAWFWCWCGGGRSLGLLCAVYVSGKSGTDHCQAFLARACALLGVVQLDQQQIGVFSHRFSIRSSAAWIRWMSRWILIWRAYPAIRFPCLSASSHVARVFHARSRMITCHTSPFLRIMGLLIAERSNLAAVEAGERWSVRRDEIG